MMVTRLRLLAVLGLLTAASAQAAGPEPKPGQFRNFINGRQLQDRCQFEDPIPCRAYIQGVIDAVWSAGQSPWQQRMNTIEVSNSDILPSAVLGYLRQHPEARDWPAAQVVISAIVEAFGRKVPAKTR